MTLLAPTITLLQTSLRRERREQAMASPRAFAEIYLAEYLHAGMSPMHLELYPRLLQASDERGSRLALAAPRGHAKSVVVSLAYALWSALSGREPFIVLASANQELAAQHLRNIREQLEYNERIKEDFPEAVRAKGSRWTTRSITLANGGLIKAVSIGEKIRGTRHNRHRPSLIIVDDLEAPDHVYSNAQRSKTREWFERTLLKAGDERTNVVIVGTILHYDSLLANLTGEDKPAGWWSRVYRALITPPTHDELWGRWSAIFSEHEEWHGVTGPKAARAFYEAHEAEMLDGAEVLWPEKEPLYELMEIKVMEGAAAFDAEKQNNPLDPETCLFSERNFKYWTDDYEDVDALLKARRKGMRLAIGWDPALGKNPRRGDYSAIVVAG